MTEPPSYIRGAKFIDNEAEIEEGLWPRETGLYSPTSKFTSRFVELGDIIDGDDITEAILYGERYAAARGCVAFVSDLGGVALYIIVSYDVPDDLSLESRPSLDQYPNLTPDDLDYVAVTLWPYVYDREKAWGTGRWSSEQLDRIDDVEPDIIEK